LEVRQHSTEVTSRGRECIPPENLFQASLVEGTVVRYKRKTFNLRGNLIPNIRENWSVFSIRLRLLNQNFQLLRPSYTWEADFGCGFTLTSSPYSIAEKAKTDAMDAMEKALNG